MSRKNQIAVVQVNGNVYPYVTAREFLRAAEVG